jgi:predicted secreted hydrolase
MPFGPPQVHLPEDEGAHPEMLTEWWYGNFGLTDSNGRQYGAMVAYFNAGLRILSICDLEAKEFHHEVSFSTPECARVSKWRFHEKSKLKRNALIKSQGFVVGAFGYKTTLDNTEQYNHRGSVKYLFTSCAIS